MTEPSIANGTESAATSAKNASVERGASAVWAPARMFEIVAAVIGCVRVVAAMVLPPLTLSLPENSPPAPPSPFLPRPTPDLLSPPPIPPLPPPPFRPLASSRASRCAVAEAATDRSPRMRPRARFPTTSPTHLARRARDPYARGFSFGPTQPMGEAGDGTPTVVADRYRVSEVLGSGAWGIVYRAADLRNDREVALKILRVEFAGSASAERFRREVAILARLDHPNIVALYDSGEIDGAPWYAMSYVRGESCRTGSRGRSRCRSSTRSTSRAKWPSRSHTRMRRRRTS